ncbi:MAG: hypothetical protein NVS3B2_16480 [Ramlibacter sp.]
MFPVAITVIAALAATTGAGLTAPSVIGRPLATIELIVIAAVFALCGWGLMASQRRRQRKRMQGMRDSALW